MIDVFAPVRPAGDILSRVIRFTLGGTEYELPVLSIRENREWKKQLNAEVAGLIGGLAEAEADYSQILNLLANQSDALLTVLISYDATGVLPSRDVVEDMRPDPSREILHAVQEVWRAANPLVVETLATVAATIELPTSGSSEPSSSSPPRTAGKPKRSRKN